MKMQGRIGVAFFFILLATAAGSAYGEVAWQEMQTWEVEGQPLAVAHSNDDKWTFVLTGQGGVVIYNAEGKLEGRIPVPPGVVDIDISRKGDLLYLVDGEKKSIREISIEFIQEINISGSPFMGPAEALVTLVVFSDFECPGCGKVAGVLEQLVDEYPETLKVVFKNFPLSFHKAAKPAAYAALAAQEQGKFWEFHDLLFANSGALTPGSLITIATQLGLDMGRFQKDINRADIIRRVEQDIEDGNGVGVSSTPSLFVNGLRLKERSLEAIKKSIEEELEKKKSH